MSKRWVIILFFTTTLSSIAQVKNRYIAFFKDKLNTPYSINQPQEFLSVKAIGRKGRIITKQDLPVTPGYVNELSQNGAYVISTTKWLNGAIIELSDLDITSIENLSFVSRVEYIASGTRPPIGGRLSNEEGKYEKEDAHQTLIQHDMLSTDQMQADGYEGEGVLIAVLDAGYKGVDQVDYFTHMYDQSRLIDTYNFVTDDRDDIYNYSNHGTRVFSTIASLGDDYKGIATKADYILYVTEDNTSEYPIEEYNWLVAAEKADSIGADIITSSLGYTDFDTPAISYTHDDLDGNTAIVTQAAELAYERGTVVISSAGNSGNGAWQKVSAPSDGEHVLAIGSVDQFQDRSGFSSFGPVAGDWVKPDLMAMGSSTILVNDKGAIVSGSGTSFAAPQVAGLVAGIWEKYTDLTNHEIVKILRESADRAGNPDFEYGYGIPNYRAFENLYNAVYKENYYNIYPNPVAGDQIHIKVIDPNLIDNILDVEIYTVDGKVLRRYTKSISWASNPLPISLSGLSKGLYLMKIVSKEQTEILRIVKQ